MNNKAKLVQHDTGPSLILTLSNNITGEPLNITGATAVMHLRRVGSTQVKETLQLTLLPGIERQDWTGRVTYSAASPYAAAGSGGRVRLDWSSSSLNTAGEFEGEVEVTLPGGRNFTIDQLARFRIRGDFA